MLQGDRAGAAWYKTAVVYEILVEAFADANRDGVGDFPGLTQKLPYLQDLGITCVRLLPFYPSPRRRDGGDIENYTAVDPVYGTLDDFKQFLDDAHSRSLRVVNDFVISHTSDHHSWFQRARASEKGSVNRAYYVWRDPETDSAPTPDVGDAAEVHWTFDAVAKQHYRHRSTPHQPELNVDSPAVVDALVDAMRFWLGLGVDGFTLIGAPGPVDRDDTPPGVRPERQDLLETLRRTIDRHYSDRILVAETPHTTNDVRAYFGDGDECHMASHMPLVPAVFMGVRMEERQPIVDVVQQTAVIPDDCQWMLFLRNHDELRLDTTTEAERDYLLSQYAPDPGMRLETGIRRRLAALMENSRPRIEMMMSLLLSLPGTPLIYYGDEIGMGDNVYLGDRNGLRTPMQWSSDRNAGFSRADPVRLYLPVVMDPVYGYESINVEAQERSPFSLLHWTKRMLALRRSRPVFGCGTLTFIPSTNRKVLAYLRADENDTILCVANLSRSATVAQLDLQDFAGARVPIELLGQSEFPPIGDEFYPVTLNAYGFYWFELKPLAVDDPRRASFSSCFISYSTRDQEFADRLYRDLLDSGVRCWFAPHDMMSGQKLQHQIDAAIRSHERVLLILSPNSMASEWVKTEIAKARQLEVVGGRQVLFPIGLAPFDSIRQWECFDADTGKDSAREIREYYIPDFSLWRDDGRYREAFHNLLEGLRSSGRRT